jgi:hypothetical protein
MASTYSGNLAIELIGTGDQAGTWGATTNTNLGTALEQAITASSSVTFVSGGNTAIALTQSNAFQAARSYRLSLSGTSSGTQYLWIPAINKQYVVNNALANSIIVSNGSNGAATGSTVTVPAGRSMILYNDATNIVEVANYIANLAVGSATISNNVVISGNVTVSGNATISGNLSAANLALSTAMPVSSGGTGVANLTYGSVMVGNNTGTVTLVAPGTANNVLTSNGTHWISQVASGGGGITTGKSIAMAMIFGF